MKVKVLFFSLLREVTGCEEMEVEVAEGGTVATLLEELKTRYPGLAPWEGKTLVAVDEVYAEPGTALREGQEVAVMPPVQGG